MEGLERGFASFVARWKLSSRPAPDIDKATMPFTWGDFCHACVCSAKTAFGAIDSIGLLQKGRAGRVGKEPTHHFFRPMPTLRETSAAGQPLTARGGEYCTKRTCTERIGLLSFALIDGRRHFPIGKTSSPGGDSSSSPVPKCTFAIGTE